MPVRPEFRHLYVTDEWRGLREFVLRRAQGRCQRCLKPDRTPVVTRTGFGQMFWRPLESRKWLNESGWPCGIEDYERLVDLPQRRILVVLSVCHADGNPENMAEDNLRAWCQWHHLKNDSPQHRNTRCEHKDAERPLLALLEGKVA